MIPLATFNREIPSEGPAIARVLYILDLGTQKSVYQGTTTEGRKVCFAFELPQHLAKGGPEKGKPLTVDRRFPASMGSKSKQLRPFIEGIRGKFTSDDEALAWWGEKLWKMVGFPLQVSIVHSESKEFANIATAQRLLKGIECPAAVHEPLFFTMVPDLWDPKPGVRFDNLIYGEVIKQFGTMKSVYGKLPARFQKLIAETKEFKGLSSGQPIQDDAPEDQGHDEGPPPTDDNCPF